MMERHSYDVHVMYACMTSIVMDKDVMSERYSYDGEAFI